MRMLCAIAAILLAIPARLALAAVPTATLPPAQLVREVVYNELHDHAKHAYWRYYISRRTAQGSQTRQQVETPEGPVDRLTQENGHPLSDQQLRDEQARLDQLLHSPSEQARRRQEYAEDENRIGRILALLPDAFLYEYAGEENGCHHLRFRPNPNYPAHSIEARIFHAMSGELWIDARSKRLARLDGTLGENVDFGYGILGRLYKGGWFRLVRAQVSPTDWKTVQLEIHMNGRAMLFKTIAKETSEVRGGFTPAPAGLNLGQAIFFLEVPENRAVLVTPASFGSPR
jgi:hypothetical protein